MKAKALASMTNRRQPSDISKAAESMTRMYAPAEGEFLSGTVISVNRSPGHTFSKQPVETIDLLAGLGVEGDAHMGRTVQHLSRVAKDPAQPNMRQVHLIQSELFQELRGCGFDILPGQMGENITTSGIDLLNLPTGTMLRLGRESAIEITGLRNPCKKIDDFRQGLMSAVVGRADDGSSVLKAGVMAVVLSSGRVRSGDGITVRLPAGPHKPLERV